MEDRSFSRHIAQALEAQQRFRASRPPFTPAASLAVEEERLSAVLRTLEERLTDNYPFFHPSYAGQMLKPPHPAATAAYLMAMQINPNNHARDGGPATAALELESVAAIARMFGFETHLGHLTSSGTIANLEALWVARSLHPERSIAFSSNAHYTHGRMCQVLGVKGIVLDSFDRFEEAVRTHDIGTVVVTLGTTSTGELEPLAALLPAARRLGVRVHIDAAYGGFFTLLSQGNAPSVEPSGFSLVRECDSVVVDPHKHALQPYGCGCVLFRDPAVGRFYKHDSPYTYFTTAELHLGEISLECSRAGAAAAALWATLQCFPLERHRGLGPVLQECRDAALSFSALLAGSALLAQYRPPELDIVTYLPRTAPFTATAVTAMTDDIFTTLMNDPADPVYLATLSVPSDAVRKYHPSFVPDAPTTRILRSVLMKPEHAPYVPELFRRVENEVRRRTEQM